MSLSFKNSKLAGVSALFLAGFVCAPIAPAHAGFDWTPPAHSGRAVNAPVLAAPAADTANKGPLTPEPDAVPAAPVEAVDASALPVVPDHGKKAVGMKTLSAKPASVTPVADTPKTEPEKVAEKPVAKEEPLVIDNTVPAPKEEAKETPKEQPKEAPVVADTQPTPAASYPDVSAPTPETPKASAPEKTVAVPPDADSQQVQGFGSDIPLAIALRDIVPSGYAYAFASKDIPGTKISWQGGKPWKQVLIDALATKGLTATSTNHVVRISPIGTAAPTTPAVPATPVVEPQSSPAPAPAPENKSENKEESKPLDLTEQNTKAPVATPAETSATPTTYSAKGMVVDLKVANKWQARPGATLHEVLNLWSKTAKVELQWLTPYDFPINNAFVYEGTFNDAVASLLASYARETPRPRGRLYPNAPDGPSVLMIN